MLRIQGHLHLMNQPLLRRSPKALALFLSAAGVALCLQAAPVEFEKLIPFAAADWVRVECVLKPGEDAPAVEVEGTLTEEKSGRLVWRGSLGQTDLQRGSTVALAQTISGLKPALWSPSSPNLHVLRAVAKKGDRSLGEKSVRFGFRSFENRNGQFHLNGRPIFLRGIAINPPGRTIPPETGESRAFATAYVKFLKSRHVNTIRLTHDSEVWFEVCDEAGMMVYQGQYGSPLGAEPGKQRPPADAGRSVAAYRQLFETYASHPSILIYVLANELPVSGARGRAYHEFLDRVHGALQPWDPTRLYIGNAGYGEGREGDICDVHRYWGWCYNTYLTYYNLRDPALFGDPAKGQPITFTECVGAFTGPTGEFNLVVRKQLGAQLNWTGHSANQREEAEAYQSFLIKQATESFRRLRPLNPRLAGIMPFTILFRHWSGIRSFEQMQPKPAMDQLGISYQPVLLSWELWTPQVYAGTTIRPVAHIINDAEDGATLRGATLEVSLEKIGGAAVSPFEVPVPDIRYYGAWSRKLEIDLPSHLSTGKYRLKGTVRAGGRLVSQNQEALFVAGPDADQPAIRLENRVCLYDPAGRTASALRRLRIPFQPLPDLASGPVPGAVLVIGEAAPGLGAAAAHLKALLEGGGRILCLRPDPATFDASWLPEPVHFFTASAHGTTYPPASRPFSGNMNINPERPQHPVFEGLDRAALARWSDYTDWDQTKPGFPRVYPVTAGFKLRNPESLARTAILANYDRGLDGIALAELFGSAGSVILCGFDLAARAGLDPAADRLLRNLVEYAATSRGHEPHPFIRRPIQWGNYASEEGVVAGPLNGLVVNADWVKPPTNPEATPLTQAQGAWNIRPGDQFVARGRRLLGPYGYSTGSSLKDLNPASELASGVFWAQIPAGKRRMITSARNPSGQAARLTVVVNDVAPDAGTIIPPGEISQITTVIPGGATNLCVRLRGSKTLVLLETKFQ